MAIKKNVEKLPKWAQKIIRDQDLKLSELSFKLSESKRANGVFEDMDWFTIGYHTQERRSLYFLDKDNANLIATIGAGSVLLVGRPKS